MATPYFVPYETVLYLDLSRTFDSLLKETDVENYHIATKRSPFYIKMYVSKIFFFCFVFSRVLSITNSCDINRASLP